MKTRNFWRALKRWFAPVFIGEFGLGRETLELVVNAAQDGLVIQDEFGVIEWCNPSFCRMTGWTRQEIIGRKPQSFLMHPDDRPSAAEVEAFRYTSDFEYLESYQVLRNIRKNGEVFWTQLNFGSIETHAGVCKYVVVARDISREVAQQEALENARKHLETAASTDKLTGLANRFWFETELTKSLTTSDTGVLNLDLDGFKEVNDSHGHAAGDAVLVYVAKALRALGGPNDLVARIGGDEFVILSPSQTQEGMTALGERILNAAADWQLDWHGSPLTVGISLGVAVEYRDGCTADELLRRSDFALYAAKDAGKGRLFSYDLEMHMVHLSARLTLNELRDGIADKAFEVMLQPICNASDGSLAGFECLLRWQHPSGETLGPPDFLGLARQHGLMFELDFISVRLAVKAQADLVAAKLEGLTCALNASPEVLSRPDYADHLIWECDRQDVDPGRICIEIHESVSSKPYSIGAVETIDRLTRAGFCVALDDFGIGNTRLTHLASMQVQSVKLDRSLVKGLPSDVPSRSILRALSGISADLGLKMVAEGVETEAQLEMVRGMGCQLVQGFLLGKPMTVEQAIEYAKSGQHAKKMA